MKAPSVTVLTVLWTAAAHPTWPKEGDCKESASVASVNNWPVLVAFKIPRMLSLGLELGLSYSNQTHTNISLTYENKESNTVELKVRVQSKGTPEDASIMALVLPKTWAQLSLNLHRKQLVLTVRGHSRTITYTTRALMDFPHHREVDRVTSSCPKACMIDVDLKCLYETRNRKKSMDKEPDFPPHPSISPGSPSWPFFLLAALFLLVLLLFIAWRYQRGQIRRWWAKAEEMARGQEGASAREQEQNSRVQYSTILKGYEGPCTGNEE